MRTEWREGSVDEEEAQICFILGRPDDDAEFSRMVAMAGDQVAGAKCTIGGQKFTRIRNTMDDSGGTAIDGRCAHNAIVVVVVI